ncbi:guanine deaminase [Thiomonas arsenitoxydans]|uniref:Guanine deaminase n=1 Tax=Thiomonas arsenitoxydans (strain DSM 22701 / CIP 110005 / 3As) TaxID=426114 RepID=D6CT25_THIA3|nr:guanine deaminase [Thiomonas arsenitoxydans]CAZ88444.1 putative guanine deaminase [Thiomonas arsenitoxydans]CQR33212.1 guanine deaminase [Thiomonas arsenitoxydans]CQR33643.1 guanine deaminase [Thiomonas arsenitoxydans]CQR33910.1 guanine deaminase [Thiomonas arsenitoxydans]CQR39680.1 guanine deaminase [Thiomonas arsenitoxydans]
MTAVNTLASTVAPGQARMALRGDILYFLRDPGWSEDATGAVRFEPDGWLLIEQGRVHAVRPADEPPDASWARQDWRGHLVMPGFIDTHVHAPQLDVIASFGAALLDWLERYTFPAEARYADPELSQLGAERFLQALLAHGTTSALVFATVHKTSSEALFAVGQRLGMRLITGKVLMDSNCPADLRDDVVQAEQDCIDLIERWHGVDRLAYAVTPRFAATSSAAQLTMAGGLLQRYAQRAGGLYMQTHVAENCDEVRWIAELFPDSRSYLDVYDRRGLLTRRSILAHGIWLDDTDRQRMAQTGSSIAFSPSSNLFLGSGLFDWAKAEAAGVSVAPASDVGGGTSLCQLRTLADGYKVLALQGQRMTAWQGLYAATRGAARALDLEHEIGHFAPGTAADVVVWRWAEGAVQQRRQDMARSLHERLFAWMLLADERNVAATYVLGQLRYRPG